MTNSKDVVKRLRQEVESDPAAHALFGWLSTYTRNVSISTVDQAEQAATRWGRENFDDDLIVSRAEVINIMRLLDDLQLGRFIVGRRGAESRFEFWSNRGQIGRAAMKLADEIDIDEEPVELEESEIIEAHRMLLANVLKRPLSQVRIKIKD
ncbi:hypothetical protein [Paracoccus salsus]|uniref:hypothetical protein n=1 Tax=Paracoccus salsus TaxID=2911061 RepID=UPI001F22BA6C|nr:hypothetical protein [Paracoccus salsus]MCF3974925.1 hypothetical protein [Paracoccus salsus]